MRELYVRQLPSQRLIDPHLHHVFLKKEVQNQAELFQLLDRGGIHSAWRRLRLPFSDEMYGTERTM
jgi:hypothetical protein